MSTQSGFRLHYPLVAQLFFLLLLQDVVLLNQCAIKVENSPIDINKPTIYANFDLTFTYKILKSINIFKDEDRHIKVSGDFGSFDYQGIKYNMNQIDILSPSEHLMANIRYPMELQIKSQEISDDFTSTITLVVLLEALPGAENKFLNSQGFGTSKLKYSGVGVSKQIEVKRATLNDLLGVKQESQMYEGQSITDDCDGSLMIIFSDTFWMSPEQAKELNDSDILLPVKARREGQIIYQNYGEILPELNLFELRAPRTPMSFFQIHHAYQPEADQKNYPIGYISAKNIPGWVGLSANQIMYKVILSTLPEGYKYIPYYYSKEPDQKKWIPRYIITEKKFRYLKNIQPLNIPIFIRSQSIKTNGIREIERIEMPVLYNKNEFNKKLNDKKSSDNGNTPPGQNDSKENKGKFNRGAPLPGQANKYNNDPLGTNGKNKKSRNKSKYVTKRVCMKWKMAVVLNQKENQLENWKKQYDSNRAALEIYKQMDNYTKNASNKTVQDSEEIDPQALQSKLLTCKHWTSFKVPESKLTDQLKLNQMNQNKNGNHSGSFDDMDMENIDKKSLKNCAFKLNIILNKRENDNIADFQAKVCKDHSKLFSFAAQKSEHSKFIKNIDKNKSQKSLSLGKQNHDQISIEKDSESYQ